MSLSLRHVLVFGLCLSMGACAFKKEDAEDQQRQNLAEDVTKKLQEEQKNNAVILKDSNISAEFVELEEPGYYQLVLKWPESVGTMEVFLDGVLTKAVSGRNTFTYNIKHNQKINLKLRAYAAPTNGGAFLSEYEADPKSPEDFIVTKSFAIKNDLTADVRRTYFLNGAQIFTAGHNLTIQTNKLYVEAIEKQDGLPEDRSHIVTFNQKTIGDSDTKISNSTISISAKYAEGILAVAMIGTDGKDGKDGADFAKTQGLPSLDLPAANGTNGKDAVVSHGKFCPPAKNMDTGCQPFEPKCQQPPEKGADGQNGLNGYDGIDGAAGGKTGNLTINVADNTSFSLEVFQKPGKGGRGGQGSPGQPGGKGGAPGANHKICPNAPPGKNGQDGQTGKNGRDGADGDIGTIETNVKSTSNRS